MAGAMLDDLATLPAARGRLLPEEVGGHNIGWDRYSGMLYAEGHPDPDGLASPDGLPDVFSDLVTAMLEAGVPVPNGVACEDLLGDRYDGFLGVRRCDGTVNLETESSAEGLAILAGVAAVMKTSSRATKTQVIFGNDGGVETVYLRGGGGKNVLGRWYDKGVESNTAARGRLIRPEDQRRYKKGHRRGVEELTAGYVRGKFAQRFATLYKASKGVTVAGPVVLIEKLWDAVEAGELTRTQAEQVAGHMMMGMGGRRTRGLSRMTEYRRREAINRLGLVLADGVLQEVEVDLGLVMEEAIDSPVWGAQG